MQGSPGRWQQGQQHQRGCDGPAGLLCPQQLGHMQAGTRHGAGSCCCSQACAQHALGDAARAHDALLHPLPNGSGPCGPDTCCQAAAQANRQSAAAAEHVGFVMLLCMRLGHTRLAGWKKRAPAGAGHASQLPLRCLCWFHAISSDHSRSQALDKEEHRGHPTRLTTTRLIGP